MNVLIIGYGSIGKRHEQVLKELAGINKIDLVSKQNISDKVVFSNLENASIDEYDYFVIASETSKHYEQLKYINSRVNNKLICCEKPLFKEYKELTPNNYIYVGYVLRFHPLLQTLKNLISQEDVYFVSVESGSYLPNWRPSGDYRRSYSASKEKGGGVLLDLSHELDYVEWLFGATKNLDCFRGNISELEIKSEDLAIMNVETVRGTRANIILNYFSKIPKRKILAHSRTKSFSLDLVMNKLIVQDINGRIIREVQESFDRNMMYSNMHMDIINKKSIAASYEDAMSIMKLISLSKTC